VNAHAKVRAAAAKLRESAQTASSWNGPDWFHDYGAVRGADQVPALITKLGSEGAAAADYAALVDPALGLLIADWLDLLASQLGAGYADWQPPAGWIPGAVADRILAGDPS